MDSFGISYVLKMIVSLIVIIIAINVLLKKMEGFSQKKNAHMRVVERMPLSKSSSLCVVEVCGKYYLMSCTEQHNEILQELDSSEWQEDLLNPAKNHPPIENLKKAFFNQKMTSLKKEMRTKF